jgi:methylmalonyl-CoA mutase, N-terminal domain
MMEKKLIYTPKDLGKIDFSKDIASPGEYPFTRGIHPHMYGERLWTMRQFAGFGSAKETNERFLMLLQRGQTGLSVAFDMPTLLAYDSDNPRARYDVGMGGVAVDTLADMEVLFDGIDLSDEHISTSMTINGPATVLLAMYFAMASKKGACRPTRLKSLSPKTNILFHHVLFLSCL